MYMQEEKKTKNKKTITSIILLIFAIVLAVPEQTNAAASSYTDAKVFYDTCTDENHIEFASQTIYFGTKAKTGSSSNKRYRTVGWEITMSAGGRSVTVDVKRGGKFLRIKLT